MDRHHITSDPFTEQCTTQSSVQHSFASVNAQYWDGCPQNIRMAAQHNVTKPEQHGTLGELAVGKWAALTCSRSPHGLIPLRCRHTLEKSQATASCLQPRARTALQALCATNKDVSEFENGLVNMSLHGLPREGTKPLGNRHLRGSARVTVSLLRMFLPHKLHIHTFASQVHLDSQQQSLVLQQSYNRFPARYTNTTERDISRKFTS